STLARWEPHFRGRFRVWFYDQLHEEPEAFFTEICSYLGITPMTDFPHAKMREKVFEGPAKPMPIPVRHYLNERFRPDLEALHRRFNNAYTEQWRKVMAC